MADVHIHRHSSNVMATGHYIAVRNPVRWPRYATWDSWLATTAAKEEKADPIWRYCHTEADCVALLNAFEHVWVGEEKSNA